MIDFAEYLRKDIDFFGEERRIFVKMLAKYSFTEPKFCRNLNRVISSLDEIINKCKLELEERTHEHKTDFVELFRDSTDISGETPYTRNPNPVNAEPERQTTWFA